MESDRGGRKAGFPRQVNDACDRASWNGTIRRTRLTDTAPLRSGRHDVQSGHGASGEVELCGLSAVRNDEVDGTEDARGLGLNFVEILHLEAVSVFGDEEFVVVRRKRGPGIDSSVVDADLDVVLARFEEF